ncbi:protein involved in polysaccharide export, contains SLBB domain of the beta-grasp fold [Marinobacter salarius]|uniref:Protein involved in polysaccharide export, contains SLBB domain of the beta-grasp fold n=1 Tax=Marinobacter salarius TaxID=1420917 RepID=A0ABY1FIB7_9GAMM|nr:MULTISPECIES: SLBB domain-containing protein [Marinobacter]KXJ43811.1 MAG: sugar transporter [Marinobacter sp. Hex_13]OLF82157.1 sugar transporter [Marinobacter sp. C18]SFL40949.1 protein involved in polysaccharide export, contains SLBB domain of the beta-grasp fold [Marinobacter salarius]
MNLTKRLLTSLALVLPVTTAAQSISQSQIEQFKSMPRAQQEALARQYGVDLDSIAGSASQQKQRPQNVNVVEPVDAISDEERERARQEQDDNEEQDRKNGGLKPYGYDLFVGSPTTFAPVTEIPIPNNYTLGPGDVLRVQLWGKENQQLELPVSRDGTVSFPQSGPQTVAGLTFDQARQQIKKRVSEQYIGVQASVSLGELRSMRVFVLGEARNAGSYTVSSLSTITNALYVSGGIKRTGSLRKIQHKRDGQLVGELDLYDLLLAGDTSNDNRLQPGDVIFIPPVGDRVGIEGEVYRPALYELKSNTNLQELVNLAGGLTPQAYPQLVRIERNNDDFLRIIAEANLTTPKGKQAKVRPGDRIEVASISDITGQYVEVKGAATRPGKFAWVPGMRVSSVINNLDTDLVPVADQRYAAIVRTDPKTDEVSVLNLRLRDAVQNPGSEQDMLLEEQDRLLIFSDAGKVNGGEEGRNFTREQLFSPVLQRLKTQAKPGAPEQTIRVTGPVRYPGEYPLPASRRVEDAIYVAGGLKDSASLYTAELARFGVDDQGTGKTRIQNLNLQAVMEGEASVTLKSRDRLLIKSIPEFAQAKTIELNGEVRYPGQYTIRDGETLRDVIKRAGGLTDNAFPEGAVFTREKLRQLEAQRLREAEERLQGDLVGVQLEGDDIGGQNAERTQQVQDLLEEVQDSRPVGRMVINLPSVVGSDVYQPIRLQDGDTLTVPVIPQSVSVFGEVQFPTSHLHMQGLTVDDYLERSGGPTRQADEERVYVVKADGSVMLPEKSRWFGGRSQKLAPGDTIIVPIDVDRLNQLELWTNVSQIVYQIALGAAAVGNL